MTPGELLDHAALPPEGALLVAVSGGMDSVVLLRALVAAGRKVQVAHVHHGLRDSADDDLAFVSSLSASLSVPFHPARVVVDKEGSPQASARVARYAALAATARDLDIRHVVTAHHADDQAETVLLNLARGSGPEGIAGMAPSAPVPGAADLTLWRPLLGRSRDELEAVARQESWEWVEDPTNSDPSYRRNAVRLRLIPVMRDIFGPNVARSLARSASLMRDYVKSDLRPMTDQLTNTLRRALPETHLRAEGHQLDLDGLRELDPVWRRRALLESLATAGLGGPSDESTALRLESLLDSQPGRHQDFPEGRVWRERDALAFVRVTAAPDTGLALAFERGRSAVYGHLNFRAQSASYYFEPTHWGAAVPTHGPFVVRGWRDGDRIAIRGGSAKVKDVLTESGVPCYCRSTFPVVVAGEDVLWIPGVRTAWIPEELKSGSTWVRLSALPD